MSFLIRVLLPDTPGSLGQLADAIGMVDGNIQSVDIVENFPDGTVMDDIVVELAAGGMADSLITAASTVDGVEVDSIRPFSGRVDRRGQIALLARVASHLHDVRAAMTEVVAAIPKALTSTWAIVIDNNEPIHRIASSDAAPEDDGTTPHDIDVTQARALNPEADSWIPASWSLLDSALAAAPIGDTGLVMAIGRTGGPDYLASEVEHLGNLGTILGAFLSDGHAGTAD
ncbi:amino acid-binding ACT domain protein [Corynebacterium sp. 32222D000AT]|uniref:amino acid-binding ACT domain protein n=1 Tax=unclassified Corynebacterium TaxID=2624378 RepID=UPI002A9223A2|nr:amino acid-binding ACT domain protein [Mycobacteriaceae bacterium]MDY5829601.1 amino acid-binding ACT domain protein [Corynebacterium sp.]